MSILFIISQRLIEVGDDVFHVFDADGEADEVGGDAGFTQLLVGELAVCMARRVEHACARVGHVGHYGDELQLVHEFEGILARALKAE